MSIEVVRPLLFPKVTDQATRSEAAGHTGLAAGTGGEFGAVLALASSRPVWAVGLAIGGGIHFILAHLNFKEAKRLKKVKKR